jgi:anti-sigma regulatory factor (Ser/Thr protein kinase)
MSRAIDKLMFHQEAAPEMGETVLALEFKSDINLKYAYILRVLEALSAGWPITLEERKKIELCLDEALQNAIMWGNGQDPGKKVKLRLWKEDGRWGITISDQGKGFSASALPDYESEEFLWQDHGRGVFILLNYLREMAYYDGGRTLVLRS